MGIEEKKDKYEEVKPQDGKMSDTNFITEKIKQRPVDKKKLLRRTVITAAMAAVFGLVACLTFLLLEPVFSNWLYPEEEPAPIVFPAETEEMLPEDMIVDESDMTANEPPPQITIDESQITAALNSLKLDASHYSDMFSGMAEVARGVKNSMVTVTGSTSNMDWFNNPYESKDQVSGVIVALQGKESYILVNYESIKDAESIFVTFHNGDQVQAELKIRDVNTKLAVISVVNEDLKKETMETITPADLSGSSGSSALVGSPVIALGSPLGSGEAICYGIVTSNTNVLNMVDANYKLISTDIYGSVHATGILINMRGQVIGIIDGNYNSEGMENLVAALGITELRKVVERLSNEKELAYLGVKGTDVTAEINETLGVPFGAYITGIEMDSPAMIAGIQSGDIITEIRGNEITSYSDLTASMMQAAPDQVVSVVFMRQGPEEYLEMEVDVTLGNHK